MTPRRCRTLPVLLLVATTCVTAQLTPEAEAVRVTTNPAAVQGCEPLGEVKGSDHLNGGIGQGAAEENARRRLRNETAKRGGNVVLVESGQTGWGGSSQRGEAYRCPAPATP